MTSLRLVLFAALLIFLLSGCGTATQSPATPLLESMKGYELYSWQDGNEWKFSVLVGTNRLKTLDEITSPDTTLSIDELKSVLENIPAGQYVTWSAGESLAFPSEDIINQVEQICEEKGVILNIAK